MNDSLNKRQWRVALLAIASALLLSAAGGSYAQSASAIITGRVLDPKGASIPGATVIATNAETGIVRTTTTTSDGLYRLGDLPVGTYNVLAEASSFAKVEFQNVKLQVGDQRDVNFNLELASQKQSVIVTSQPPLVEATKTDVSSVIDEKDVSDLPISTSFGSSAVANDYATLAASAPGVKYDYAGLDIDPMGPGAVNARGATVNVDGGNISDPVQSSRGYLGASLEEVKEFQVLSNNYDAEYGQAGALILNVVTKSGANDFHGDAHGYFRGRNFGASDFFYNLSGDPDRAPFFKHEEGFTAGGPFVKDRLFWFTSLERTDEGSPLTVTPFDTTVTVPEDTYELLWSAKLDAKLTEKHMLTIRYNVERDANGNVLDSTGPDTAASALQNVASHYSGFNVGMISTLTPHTANEARFFWSRILSLEPDNTTVPGQSLPNAYVGANFCCPSGAFRTRFEYLDNLSWTRSNHTFKFGANINHYPVSSTFQQYHNGNYSSFTALQTCAPYGLCPTEFTVSDGAGFASTVDTDYGLYAQDAWQFRHHITVNYGLRYDIEDGAFKGGTIPDSSVPGGCVQANGLIPACGSDHGHWQPRLGVAWGPNFEHGILHWIFGDPGNSVVRAAGAKITEMAELNIVLDSLTDDGKNLLISSISAADCFTPTGAPTSPGSQTDPQACAVLQAYPNFPSFSALAPYTQGVITNFGKVRPISPTINNPEITMASLVIQRQVGSSFTYSIGYQGVFGHGLYGETDKNYPTPIADPSHSGFFYMPDRPDPNFGAVRTNFSDRTSGYNSLVVTAQKRLAHHFQFQANYTWSKLMSDGEDFYGLSEPANPLAALSLDNALASEDVRHLANFSFVADTNRLLNTPIVSKILNNWTFGMLGTLQSGRPFPISTGDGVFSGSVFYGLGEETNQRPNVLANGNLIATNIGSISGTNLEVGQSGVLACETAGLANCAQLQTTFDAPAGASLSGPKDSFSGQVVDFQYISGNLARNAGQSLPLYSFNVSLTKSIKIPKWESASVELRLDAFNVFNHPLFIENNGNDVLNVLSLPPLQVNGVANPNFNCTVSCINPFSGLYFGANGQPLTLASFQRATFDQAKNFNALGGPAATVGPRVLQLAIRFRW
jgi:hypothetical protein